MILRLAIIVLGVLLMVSLAKLASDPIKHYRACPTWGQC